MAVRKIPMRRCVGCGQSKSKKELIRIVKIEDGPAVIDTTGRKNGRGAYLCLDVNCLNKARKTKGLERSLKEAIPIEVYECLEKEMSVLEK